jgi:RES domain
MASGAGQLGPAPPSTHLPTLRLVPAGPWWRVHAFDRSSNKPRATSLNDSGLGNARFSPLRDASAQVIPTLYAAATPRTAIAEVLFHDAPVPSTGWSYDWTRDRNSSLHLSQIELPELSLAALTSFGLQAAGLRVEDLLAGDADEYPRTRSWARWIHDEMPHVQGLFWMSRRDNEHSCLMLFGDRLANPPPIVELSSKPIALYELDVLQTLDLLGASLV